MWHKLVLASDDDRKEELERHELDVDTESKKKRRQQMFDIPLIKFLT